MVYKLSQEEKDRRKSKIASMVECGETSKKMAEELQLTTTYVYQVLKELNLKYDRKNNKWITKDRKLWTSRDRETQEWCDPCITREAALREWENPDLVGRVEYYKPVVDAMGVIENLEQFALNEYGECSENWLDHLMFNSHEVLDLQDRLTETFTQWLRFYNLQPRFFSVTKIEEVEEFDPEY